MAKAIRKRDVKRRSVKDDKLPLGRENFVIIGLGLLVILAGYLAMLEGSVEGFLPLYVAPILLVIGYCILIPLGILFKKSYIRSADARSQNLAFDTAAERKGGSIPESGAH